MGLKYGGMWTEWPGTGAALVRKQSPHVDESKATFAVQCLLHEVLIQEGQGNLEHIIKAFSCSESDSSGVWDSRTLLTSIAATARSAGTAA